MNVRLREILTWTVYPGVMLIRLMIYYGLTSYGINIFLSSYIATIISGVGRMSFLKQMQAPFIKDIDMAQ
ncbi:MAG: hypothetical protein DSM106950_18380 [Stigonema ocellatum SAG 48.90 = DSM 106950]|nr:hypothetical protein [Stigonema ocellatum SAG 48.90 = DSM 106950]